MGTNCYNEAATTKTAIRKPASCCNQMESAAMKLLQKSCNCTSCCNKYATTLAAVMNMQLHKLLQ